MPEFNTTDESETKKESTSESIKFCPQCGKEITQLSKFCPHCGHSLENFTNQPKSDAPSQSRVAEDDFIAFIGNNAGYYMHEFKKFNMRRRGCLFTYLELAGIFRRVRVAALQKNVRMECCSLRLDAVCHIWAWPRG